MTSVPKPKILVVDDTTANLVAMRRLLRTIEADIVEANNGELALRACIDEEFALVLLDINMPGMDGFEVATLLQEEASTRDMPIIFLTAAYGDDVSRLKGYGAGAVDFITKPVEPAILLSKVRVFMELYQRRLELQVALDSLAERNVELQAAQQALQHQAHHDGLTGLPNRSLFRDRLDQALSMAARHQSSFAVLYVDIDGFKPVNDRLGHDAGDRVLKEIARRLSAQMRDSDTVARLGGDEFAIIANDVGQPDELLTLGRKLCARLSEDYGLAVPAGEPPLILGASIGIAVYPRHGLDAETLLHAADATMYEAKHGGKAHALMAASPT
ncbi:diguanylate cyclase domain-containing protein [Polycyclovorans algicola]|uniref:diguanylate cyclase domain-containing protein n=1 Tax=Polycyclovorans algicola TaxID=616992 RepID=UPI0004A70A99|nr:diguanylate cyclase [Polycyclovorans algicola]